MSAGAISGRGQYSLVNTVPHNKSSHLISSKSLRVFYDGGHYSLRGDIIHGGTVFTPTPGTHALYAPPLLSSRASAHVAHMLLVVHGSIWGGSFMMSKVFEYGLC